MSGTYVLWVSRGFGWENRFMGSWVEVERERRAPMTQGVSQ